MGFKSIQSYRVQENMLMLRCFVVSCLSAISLFIFLFTANPLLAQSKNSVSINFKIDNVRLSSALYRLANEADMNFTYDAGDSLFNTKLSYTAVDKMPIVILEELLSNTKLTYKQIGNQVVIYKVQQSPLEEVSNNEEPMIAAIKNDILPEKVIDTIFILDTVFSIQKDTIRITDTIFIEKEKPKTQVTAKLKEIPVDYFNPTSSREKGWAAGVFFAPVASNFSLVRQKNTLSVRNFSMGIEASKIFNNWNISAGLKLTHFAEKFNHTYDITDGGYFVTDTIDEYYTVIQADTNWYYVTDSTWKPIDNHEYSYNINNRVGYLEFVAALSYDYYSDRKIRLYAKAGVQAGVLIYRAGLAIPDANEPAGVDFANLKFNTPSYSILAGAGVKYRINETIDFNSELYYFQNINSVVINYPANKKINGVGLKFGLIYYF
ncbi:MAG: hypothetical protein H8E34_11380 [Bacteroidetes bacterium]|nr:hypothetical protein [Bacteroidota bacterium]MBL6943856.1 hypothetical protein [Bacteroidales bacterium]